MKGHNTKDGRYYTFRKRLIIQSRVLHIPAPAYKVKFSKSLHNHLPPPPNTNTNTHALPKGITDLIWEINNSVLPIMPRTIRPRFQRIGFYVRNAEHKKINKCKRQYRDLGWFGPLGEMGAIWHLRLWFLFYCLVRMGIFQGIHAVH